jgi:hypothetical protein
LGENQASGGASEEADFQDVEGPCAGVAGTMRDFVLGGRIFDALLEVGELHLQFGHEIGGGAFKTFFAVVLKFFRLVGES